MHTFTAYLEKRLVEDNLYHEGWFGDFMDTITGGRWGAYQDYRADAKQTRLANLSKKAALKAGNQITGKLEYAQKFLDAQVRNSLMEIRTALGQLEKAQQEAIQTLQNTKMKTPDGANIFTPEQLQFLNQIQAILDKNKVDVNKSLDRASATLGHTVQASKYSTSEIINLANHAASVIGSTKRFNPDTVAPYTAPDVAKWNQENLSPAGQQQSRASAAAKRAAEERRKNLSPEEQARLQRDRDRKKKTG